MIFMRVLVPSTIGMCLLTIFLNLTTQITPIISSDGFDGIVFVFLCTLCCATLVYQMSLSFVLHFISNYGTKRKRITDNKDKYSISTRYRCLNFPRSSFITILLKLFRKSIYRLKWKIVSWKIKLDLVLEKSNSFLKIKEFN